MLVEVLKSNYIIVLAEDAKDNQWLDKAGYMKIGEEYYQELFNNEKELISEVNYLLDYGAVFEDREDEHAPLKYLNLLKDQGLIK